MKFNQITFIITVLSSSFPCFSSENLQIAHYEKKFHAQLKEEKFKEQLRNISDAWKNYDPQKRIKLDPKIYALIREKFSNKSILFDPISTSKKSEPIKITPNINITEEDFLFREIAYLKKQTIIKEQEPYKTISRFYKEQTIILNNILNQNKPSRNQCINQNKNTTPHEKRKRNKNKSFQQEKSIPKQLYDARKILFTEYNIKDEIELKQKLLDHAIEYENQNISNFIFDTIKNTNCSFIFCGKCQIFKIFHNTTHYDKSFCNNCLQIKKNKKKRNKKSFNTTSSCDDLKINVITLPQ